MNLIRKGEPKTLKKGTKVFLLLGLTLLILLPLQAIANQEEDLGEPSLYLKVGEKKELTAIAEFLKDVDPEDYDIDWESSNTDVARINSKGVIEGVQAGKAKITATVTGATNVQATAVVEVISTVDDLKVAEEEINIKVGEEYQLQYEVLPSTAFNKNVKFRSSDSNIAKVNSNTGLITGISEGTAVITASTVDKGKNPEKPIEKTITVNVDSTVTGVKILNKGPIELKVDETAELKYEVLPNDAYLKDVIIKTENSKVATVNSRTGVITARGNGTTTITVETKDGGYTDTIDVIVTGGEPEKNLDSVNIIADDQKNDVVNLYVGEERQLELSYSPADVKLYAKDISFSTEDTDFVKVTQNGRITGLKEGKATVTVFAKGATDTVTVNVISTVKGIEGEDEWHLKVGEVAKPPVHVVPYNAFNRNLIITHNGKDVIKVNTNEATIEGLKEGVVKAKFTTEDGGYTHEMTIYVEGVAKSFDIPFEKLELGLKPYVIEPVFEPADVLNKEVKYEILGENIISINSKTNTITPKKEGETVVRATSVDGGFVDEFTVVVDFDVTDLKIYDENNQLIGSSDPSDEVEKPTKPEDSNNGNDNDEGTTDDKDNDGLSYIRKLIIEALLERTDHPLIKQVLMNMLKNN
jgi:uncharacterized protein YjdB